MEDRLGHILSIGKKHTANEWAVLLNTTKSAVYSYFKNYKKTIGHLIDQRPPCRSEPVRDLMEKEGKEYTVNDWATLLNFKVSDIRNAVAKYPHLKSYIVKQKNRTVFRLPKEWGIEIENSTEKRTMRQWSEHLGCDIDVLRSYVGQRRYLRQFIILQFDDKLKKMLESLESIRHELPLKKIILCEKMGTTPSTFNVYKEEILEHMGMTIDQVVQKPIKAEIIKMISETDELYTITEWSNLFEVDISHVSRIVHKNNLLMKIRPTTAMPVFRAYQRSIREMDFDSKTEA
jgi:hypothetical protein